MFLLINYSMTAQTLPTMPPGGPDNGTFDKSGRYPAGTVNHTSFYSAVAGKNVDLWVYTPPGYSTSQKYGVVYGYQGIGVDAGSIFYDWCVKAAIVCDNLIGEGKISKGVIIVAVDDQFNGNNSNVNDMTIRDAIPYIDSHYSTYADADHRGLYGYSWGGGYTFNVGCANLDYFHYLGPSAAAPNKAGDGTLFPNGGAYAKQVMKCLFISWGQNDYQSIIDANVACDNYCNNNGIPHYTWVGLGQGHTAGVWRPAMWNFLQLADRAGISSSGGCTPTTITPYVQVNGGAWQQTGSVTVASGATVVLGPQPVSGGSWSWSGCGASGSSREQTITLTSSCTATATYTNGCGATSTHSFAITVNGGGATYVTIANRTTGLLIDGMGRTSNGSICGQWNSSGSSNQQWTLETAGSYVKIKNRATGLYLDGMGYTTNGSTANQYSSSTSNNQQWTQETAGSYIKFRNLATGLYLDGMGRTSNGSDLGQWSSSTDNNQQWTVSTLKSAIAPDAVASVKESLAGSIASPNPVTSVLKLQLSAPVNEIVVYSIEGKQLYKLKTTSKNVEIDMSGFKSGVYVLKAVGEHETWTQQIVKQ
jgi:enterochelin esterase family protein